MKKETIKINGLSASAKENSDVLISIKKISLKKYEKLLEIRHENIDYSSDENFLDIALNEISFNIEKETLGIPKTIIEYIEIAIKNGSELLRIVKQ